MTFFSFYICNRRYFTFVTFFFTFVTFFFTYDVEFLHLAFLFFTYVAIVTFVTVFTFKVPTTATEKHCMNSSICRDKS